MRKDETMSITVLIAPSGFKESLPVDDVTRAIAKGVLRAMPGATILSAPMVDGGEGTTRAIIAATKGRIFDTRVTGPVGDSVPSFWGMMGGTGPATAPAASTEAAEIQAQFRAALADKRAAELDRGLTLVGPHRDDLLLRVRGLPVKGYASHGESWSLALALRLGGFMLVRDDGVEPVLVLDDVFAELDQMRRGVLKDTAAG